MKGEKGAEEREELKKEMMRKMIWEATFGGHRKSTDRIWKGRRDEKRERLLDSLHHATPWRPLDASLSPRGAVPDHDPTCLVGPFLFLSIFSVVHSTTCPLTCSVSFRILLGARAPVSYFYFILFYLFIFFWPHLATAPLPLRYCSLSQMPMLKTN